MVFLGCLRHTVSQICMGWNSLMPLATAATCRGMKLFKEFCKNLQNQSEDSDLNALFSGPELLQNL